VVPSHLCTFQFLIQSDNKGWAAGDNAVAEDAFASHGSYDTLHRTEPVAVRCVVRLESQDVWNW